MYLQMALGWLIKLVVLVTVIAVAWWLITNPVTAANFVVAIVSGVKTFVVTIISGITGLFN